MPLSKRKPTPKPPEDSTDPPVRYRSVKTGGYVSEKYAQKHPETTVKETDSPDDE